MFEGYAFVALTTTNLDEARRFWIDALGFPIVQEKKNYYFIVDAAGLRLCIDTADGNAHIAGSTDPVIGLRVKSLAPVLAQLTRKGITPEADPVRTERGAWAMIRDPDGRCVVITETE